MKKIIRAVILFVVIINVFMLTCCGKSETNKVEIEFETNGGTLIEKMIVDVDSEIDLPVTEKTGYDFLGWHTKSDFSDSVLTNKYKVTDNAKLFAQWKIKSYTVKIINGENIVDTVSVEYNNTLKFDFSQQGIVVEGLFINKELTDKFDLNTKIVKDTDLYVKTGDFALSSENSVLSWTDIKDATSYNVYVNGIKCSDKKITSFDVKDYLMLNATNPVYVEVIKDEEVIGVSNIIYLSCHKQKDVGFCSEYILKDGDLYVVGLNNYGQLANGNKNDVKVLTKIISSVKFEGVSAGSSHVIVLDKNGEVWTAGSNEYGQLGTDKSLLCSEVLIKVALPEKAIAVFTGDNASFVCGVSGSVYAFGANDNCQLGISDNTKTSVYKPTKVDIKEGVISIASGTAHTLFLTEKQNIYGVGSNFYGQLGNNKYSTDYGTTPSFAKETSLVLMTCVKGPYKSIDAGDYTSVVETSDGKFYAMGANQYGQMGNNKNWIDYDKEVDIDDRGRYYEKEAVELQITGEKINQVQCGKGYIVVRTDSGKIYISGKTDFLINKQDTDDPATNKQLTVLETGMISDNIIVSSHNIMIESENKIYVMGNNDYGQIVGGTVGEVCYKPILLI